MKPVAPYSVQEWRLEEVPERLEQMRDLYSNAYHSSHMFESLQADLDKQPELFRMFVAVNESEQVIGSRVIELKEDMHLTYPDLDYLGMTPIWGKRFAVKPEHRGTGVGKSILEISNNYGFNELKAKAIFGSSAEVGALSMYGRAGALYLKPTIANYSHKNTPEENLSFFREFMVNPFFRAYRLPKSSQSDIRYAYPSDTETKELLQANGYITYQELVALNN